MQYPTIKASQDASDNLGMSTKVTIAEFNEAITDEFCAKYSQDGRKLLKVPYELNGTYSIKEGVRIICDKAFFYCRSLTDIVIPDSVISIGDKAFFRCSSLTSLVIPDGVTRIGTGTFFGCESLSSLVIPNGVTCIGDGAFSGCRFLSGIVIPNSVTSIGDCAFGGCSSFLIKYISIPKNVICLNGNPFANWHGKLECLSPNFIYEDDVLFNKDKSKIISFRNQAIRSYIIPGSVTSIGDYAFEGCSFLSDIVIPTSVTNIGRGAFRGCNFPTDLKQELISRFGEKIFR